jgi:hypothetical protein
VDLHGRTPTVTASAPPPTKGSDAEPCTSGDRSAGGFSSPTRCLPTVMRAHRWPGGAPTVRSALFRVQNEADLSELPGRVSAPRPPAAPFAPERPRSAPVSCRTQNRPNPTQTVERGHVAGRHGGAQVGQEQRSKFQGRSLAGRAGVRPPVRVCGCESEGTSSSGVCGDCARSGARKPNRDGARRRPTRRSKNTK